MGFMDAVKSVYSQYATFSGRASRSEYWWYTLFYTIVYLALYVPALAMLGAGAESGSVSPMATVLLLVFAAFAIGSLLPSISVLVRRLHDTNRSGWWFWISLVPFVGSIILLVFMILPSTDGPNEYGSQP